MATLNVILLVLASLLLIANAVMLYHNYRSMRHLGFILHSFVKSQKQFEDILNQERSKGIAPE
jgi:hypothetical protein